MEDAKGIPERGKKGTIPKDRLSKWKLNIQRHKADKAGEHLDIRLNPPGSDKAYSWAARRFPKPGEKTTAVQTDIHDKDYMGFSGEIREGYGKGKVKSLTLEDVEVLKSDDDHVKFNRYKGSDSERYIMMRKPGTDEFLFYNYTPTEKSKIYEDVPKYKEKYKNVPLDKLDPKIRSDKEVWSPKLDGAHNLVVLRGGKNPDVFSYRKSRKEGDKFIDHTYRTKIYDQRIPKEFKKTILRGELFVPGKRGNETAGLLNSNVWKAREGNPLDLNVFDVVKWKGKDVENLPFKEKLKMLQEVEDKIPGLRHTPWATTEKEKENLRRQMLNKENPLTEEGLAIYDLDSPTPRKSKQEDDWDGEIVGTFKATPGSKYAGSAIGGFLVRPEGSDTTIRVGSGLDDQTRQEAFQNPDKFKGRWAKFKSQHVHKSGKHQAPIFKEMRADKFYRPNEKTAKLIIKLARTMSKKEENKVNKGVVAGGALSAVGAKGAYDAHRVDKGFDTWGKQISDAAKSKKGPGQIDAVYDAYIKGGKNLSDKRFLGMRSGNALHKVVDAVNKGQIPFLKDDVSLAGDAEHYKKFTSTNAKDLKNYMTSKGVKNNFEGSFTGKANVIKNNPNLSISQKIKAMEDANMKPAAKAFSTAAGKFGGEMLAIPGKYKKTLAPHLKNVKRVGGGVAALGAGVAGLSALAGREKKASGDFNSKIDAITKREINKARKDAGKNMAASGAQMAAFSGAVDFLGQKSGLLQSRGLKSGLGLAGLFGGVSAGIQGVREIGPYRRKVRSLKDHANFIKDRNKNMESIFNKGE